MDKFNILTANLALSTLIFAIAARIYVLPRLAQLQPKAVLYPILLLHSFRHLGLMFLAPGAVYAGIAAEFTGPAAWGDFIASMLALASIAALAVGSKLARPLLWIFNIEGSLDLLDAIVLATVWNAAPFMGAAYWIPAFWVPALIVTHYIVFRVLLSRRALVEVKHHAGNTHLA